MVRVEVPVGGEVLQPDLLAALNRLAPLAPVLLGVALDGPVAVHILLHQTVIVWFQKWTDLMSLSSAELSRFNVHKNLE